MNEDDGAAAESSPGTSAPSEFEAIARWVATLPTSGPAVLVGPGDDVAVLRISGNLAVSTDTAVAGVHFTWATFSPEDVGWKSMAAALSDLAAARATPLGAVVALTSGRDDQTRRDGIMNGIAACARDFDCPVVGGDTTSTSGPLTVTITVLGRSERPLLRDGARPGDVLLLSGDVGWAAAGLRGDGGGRGAQAQRRPRPRLDLVPTLAPAHAGIDVSDGLLADAAHIAAASAVTLEVDPELATPGALREAVGPAAERLALTGGEDYELLVAAPHPLPGFTRVGRVLARGDHDLVRPDGSPFDTSRGWVHP